MFFFRVPPPHIRSQFDNIHGSPWSQKLGIFNAAKKRSNHMVHTRPAILNGAPEGSCVSLALLRKQGTYHLGRWVDACGAFVGVSFLVARRLGSVCASSPPLTNLERHKTKITYICKFNHRTCGGLGWHFAALFHEKGGGIHHQDEGHAVQEGEGVVAGSMEEHEVQRGRPEHPHLHGREPGADAARLRRRRQAGICLSTDSSGGDDF